MKLPEIQRHNRRWDEFRAFHAKTGPFVQFETGELMIRTPKLEPYKRKRWSEFDLEIVSTNDSWCPSLLDRDKDPVPKAQLNQGGAQYLVLDQGKAYPISFNWKRTQYHQIGANFKDANILWPVAGKDPITFEKVKVSKPNRDLKKSMKPFVDDVRAICRAIIKMKGEGVSCWDQVPYFIHDPHLLEDMSPNDFVQKLSASGSVGQVAHSGIRFARDDFYFDHLIIA